MSIWPYLHHLCRIQQHALKPFFTRNRFGYPEFPNSVRVQLRLVCPQQCFSGRDGLGPHACFPTIPASILKMLRRKCPQESDPLVIPLPHEGLKGRLEDLPDPSRSNRGWCLGFYKISTCNQESVPSRERWASDWRANEASGSSKCRSTVNAPERCKQRCNGEVVSRKVPPKEAQVTFILNGYVLRD